MSKEDMQAKMRNFMDALTKLMDESDANAKEEEAKREQQIGAFFDEIIHLVNTRVAEGAIESNRLAAITVGMVGAAIAGIELARDQELDQENVQMLTDSYIEKMYAALEVSFEREQAKRHKTAEAA